MKNKLNYIFLIFIFNYVINFNAYGADIFNFDVTELEIIEKGNKFIGKNGGTVTSEDGTVIKAKNFEYDKIKNILIAFGNVEIIDEKEAMSKYGSSDSGASLGDILGSVLKKKK